MEKRSHVISPTEDIYIHHLSATRQRTSDIESLTVRWRRHLLDAQSFRPIDAMLSCRLMTSLLFTVLHTMTSSFNEDFSIPRDHINVNVGKRIRMECELNISMSDDNRKVSQRSRRLDFDRLLVVIPPPVQGLWLRLEDAEVFFYATSRISTDQRYQIEQRPVLHVINGSSSHEIMAYTLIVNDLRSSDEGTYSCQADNKIIKLFIVSVVGESMRRLLSHYLTEPLRSLKNGPISSHTSTRHSYERTSTEIFPLPARRKVNRVHPSAGSRRSMVRR